MKKTSLLIAFAIMCSLSCSAAQNIKRYTISQKAMLDRFMEYVAIESPSGDPKSDDFLLTEGQKQMAEKLAADAKALGAEVYVSDWYYVYVTIPSNIKRQVPTMGISCHLDYTPEAPGKGIKPKVIKYKGGPIELSPGETIDPDAVEGQELPDLIGKTLIHTDGKTLLGGDDKNGCAIVMSVIESAMKNGFRHGELKFVFCPNEDCGKSAWKIDPEHFSPDILVDVDGEGAHEVSVSNFTALGLKLYFKSHDAHPGNAKAMQYGDALAAAATYIANVPLQYRPEHTDGMQGYIHPYLLTKVSDTTNHYTVDIRIRYFDKEEGKELARIAKDNIGLVKKSFPYVGIEIQSEVIQYDNVAYSMHPQSIPLIKKAASRCGITLDLVDTRGGTTAAMFTAKGLRGGLCVFSGQHNIHSPKEFSVLEEMYDSYQLLLTMIDEVTMMK